MSSQITSVHPVVLTISRLFCLHMFSQLLFILLPSPTPNSTWIASSYKQEVNAMKKESIFTAS